MLLESHRISRTPYCMVTMEQKQKGKKTNSQSYQQFCTQQDWAEKDTRSVTRVVTVVRSFVSLVTDAGPFKIVTPLVMTYFLTALPASASILCNSAGQCIGTPDRFVPPHVAHCAEQSGTVRTLAPLIKPTVLNRVAAVADCAEPNSSCSTLCRTRRHCAGPRPGGSYL